MKLAEALILRADFIKEIKELKDLINKSSEKEQDEVVQYKMSELVRSFSEKSLELERLTAKINLTNATFSQSGVTLTEMLAERECLASLKNLYSDLTNRTISEPAWRHDRRKKDEVKTVLSYSPKDYIKNRDEVFKKYRELDTKIQELNWRVELV